ncbi:MAG: hypothetical protein LQ348_004519 [Seirophora lacunosa]|nr:MAG: hypothetical protein LQ348_004519 [Seirophora lacunosa]
MAGEKPYAAMRANSGEESDNVEQGKLHTGSDYSKTFSPQKQTWQLLADQLFRLVFTAILVALTIITLKVYEQKGPVAHDDKIVFNTVITVLNLALGLNFLEAFKDMAKVLRWRVLANRRFTVRETDLILGGESLLNLATLMRESMRKPLTFSICAFWIFLNILAQASIALIGLNYSMDNGIDSTGVTTSRDMVSFPRIDCYYNNENCTTDPDQPPEVAQNQAHAYGEASLRERACNYTTDEDIFMQPQNCTYFARTNGREFGQEFAYRYAEYNPGDRARAYPYLTKRLIKTSTGQCYQYKQGPGYFEVSPDGPDSVSVWPYSNGTTEGLLRIARTNMAFDSTTYAYTGLQAPQNASAVTCGPRCIWLYAARQGGTVTHRGNDIFMCPITVSEVSDAQRPEHEVPDPTARLAAASIALSGRYTNPNGSDEKHWQQFQWFPYGSFWETDNLPAQAVGRRMAEFAIGSLASMSNYNVHTRIPGTLPTLGYSLSVKWEFIIALAAVITGMHCLLVGLILFIARPIVVPADSNLVVAKLLGGLAGRVGERGNLLEAKEMAEAIEKEGHGHGSGDAVSAGTVGYGVREAEPGTVLEIGEGLVRRKNLKSRVFPRGLYA